MKDTKDIARACKPRKIKFPNVLTGPRSGFLNLAILMLAGCSAAPEEPTPGVDGQLLALIRQDEPYTMVPAELFEQLGWDLPDAGGHVKELADSAQGGAFNPQDLESLPADELGYRPSWHVIRYPHYGLEWEITGLLLAPETPEPGLPTVAFIHGGSANWYEFFLDPLNNPGLGQYLAQRAPVLLITIPGNYKPGGWTADYPERRPAYLLAEEFSNPELELRNAVFTFTLICEGVERLIREVTQGSLLIAGHSTGGEIQFLLKDRLRDRLDGRSLGWGTGGPALLRRQWDEEMDGRPQPYRSILTVRGRSPEGYVRSNYVGPLNPVGGQTELGIAEEWFRREGRRRPQFKQPIQDLEHTAQVEYRDQVEEEIRSASVASGLPLDVDEVLADLFSTMEPSLEGYQKMIWTTATGDAGHWDPDPGRARELDVAGRLRERNPEAFIRVVVFDVPMSHYGHIEKPRQLAGGILAAMKMLYHEE